MPRLIGGLAAFAALTAGILYSVEPITVVLRAALAFLLGSLATQLWYVFFTVRVHTISADPDELEALPSEAGEPPAAAA